MSSKRLAQAALAVTVVAIAWIVAFSGGHHYRLRVELPNAQGLKKNGSIKIAGITAGTAEKFDVTRRGTVIVTFDMDKSAAPVGAGATVDVRPANLLGERYAEIHPGDPRRPLPSGSLIPRSHTSVSTELDDVLSILDQPTRTALRILVNEAGVALSGRGADFNKLLGELPGSLERTRGLIGEVAGQNAALGRLIAQGDRVVGAVHGRRDALGRLVDGSMAALDTVASRRRELGETVAGAPGALDRLRTTLGALDETAGALRPAAVDLGAAAAPLSATLRELPGFAHAADGTLQTAVKVAPDLRRLGRDATPTVARLRPTLDRLESVVGTSRPSVDALAVPSGGIEQLMWFLQTFGRTAQDSDGVGHIYGIHVSVSDQLINNMLDRLRGPKTSDRRGRRRLRPRPGAVTGLPKQVLSGAPAVKKLLPKVGQTVDKTLGRVTKTLNGVLGGHSGEGQRGDPSSSATGDSVSHLLDFLLGP